MPETIAAVSAALSATAFTIGSTAITVSTVIKTAIVVGGMIEANRARQAARGAYNASLRDRTVTVRSSEAPRRTVYGIARVGGVIVYGCNSGDRREYLHLVLAFASHKVHSIDDVWLADRTIGTLDGSGFVQAGSVAHRVKPSAASADFVVPGFPYTYTLPEPATAIMSVAYNSAPGQYQPLSYTHPTASTLQFTGADEGKSVICTYERNVGGPALQVIKFVGDPVRDTDLETYSAGQWTLDHVGNDIARIRASFKPDPDTFPNGLQNVSVIVHGKKLYDPRTGLYSWSDNPALQVLDYLMAQHGFRATLSEINIPSFIAAANICDELVPIDGGTQKRYAGGGIASEEADRFENLRGLLSTMVGEAVCVAGIWYVRAGAFYASAMTLDDSDFAGGDVQITANTPRRSLFNGVKGRFISPDDLWTYTDFPAYTSFAYEAEDGGEKILADIDLPFIQDPIRAQRVAKLVLHKARQSMTVQAEFKLKALPITPLTTIRIKNSEMGWDLIDGGLGKLFTVVDRTFNTDRFTVSLVLREEAEEVYDWDYSEANSLDPSPNTTLKDPREIDALTGLTVTSNATTYKALKDGTIVPFVLLEWDAVDDALVTDGGFIRVIWKRANEVDFQSVMLPGTATSYIIDGIGPGEILNIGAQAVNGAQVSGPLVFNTHTASASLVTNSQSPRFGLGTNLLENACLKSGVGGWQVYNTGGYAGTVAHQIAANGAPKPFGAVFLSIPSGAIAANVSAAYNGGIRVPVIPGQRIEAQAKIQAFRGTASLGIEFYNAAGAQVGAGLAGGVSATSADSLAWTQSLADFKPLWGFYTAPAGAVEAFITVYASRTSTAASTDIYITQPYIGVAHENQTLPSPWTDGPPRGALAMANIATTSLIAASAATQVSQSLSSSTGTITGGAFFDLETIVHTLTLTNADAEAYNANVSGIVQVEVSTDAGWPGDAQMLITVTGESIAPAAEPRDYFNVAGGATGIKQSFQIGRTVTVPAFGAVTFSLMIICAPHMQINWKYPKIRAEMIKR